jgi:hypothetical protein
MRRALFALLLPPLAACSGSIGGAVDAPPPDNAPSASDAGNPGSVPLGQGGTGGDGGTSGDGGTGGNGHGDGGGDGDGATTISLANRGGTRLHARYHATADGTNSFVGWFDSQLQTNCAFSPGADGQERCLPSANVVNITSYYFKDAACTQPIVEDVVGLRPCATPPRYIRLADDTSCPNRTRVFSIGARLAGTSYFYRDDSNVCQAGTLNLGPYYDVGAEVAAASFVSATETAGPNLSGVEPKRFNGSDGSQGFSRFVDTARNTTCTFRIAADGAQRCLPDTDALVNNADFSDAACTVRGTAWRFTSMRTCPAPTLAILSEQNGCVERLHMFGVGAATTPYYFNGKSCVVGENAIYPTFRLNAEQAATSFVAGPAGTFSASPRVQMSSIVLGGEPFDTKPYDTQRKEECSFRPAADGKLRCLPTNAVPTRFYADAQCTQPVVLSTPPPPGCTIVPTIAVAEDSTSCPTRYRYFARGATVTSALFQKNDASCDQLASSTQVQAVGAELPASTFVEANLVDR